MELDDYQTWRSMPEGRSRLLLDSDMEQPPHEVLEGDDAPLARIAVAIHANAPTLAPEDCEQVVRWMKRWKRERSLGSRTRERDGYAFGTVLCELRDSPAQTNLMQKAAQHEIVADVWTVLAAVIVGAALVCALAPGIRWYWSVATFFVAIAVYKRGQRRWIEAAKVWQEQDRRYLMQSVSAASTVQEMALAGLFAFLPGAEFGPLYNEDVAVAALRRERERLADALYYDPNGWLRE